MQLDVKLTQLVVLVAALLAIDMDIGEVLYHLARFLCMRSINDRVPVHPKEFCLADFNPALCRRRFRFFAHEIEEIE
ncbi:hypothetical protein GN958_ATG01381 [Phytophthora infestans]|uniref:Uncharacterized protein n=1 Tax=Phytophthora infestans TaxID=4787 RepID=A0A8S9VDZ0_PHYIN|nr:hypothetical protein GN958_ATG01381 [Phytophthora infestans]